VKTLTIFIIFLTFLSSCVSQKQAKNFKLSSNDKIITLHDFKGKALLLYFGFASCPDVCPVSLSKIKSVVKKLTPDERKKLNVLFVSVDYKRDKPSDVDKYAKYFEKTFMGATGTKEQIELIAQRYGVYYEFVPLEDSAFDYTVDHSSYVYMINHKGELINQVRSDKMNANTVKEIQNIINEI
jgi:protein SCO1/2